MQIVFSLLGVAGLLGIALLLSDNRRAICLRTVFGAFVIQTILCAFVLHIPIGQTALVSISEGVQHIIDFGNEGIGFLFGDLARFKLGFVFAINVLTIIIFFSSLMAVLYHLGVMQLIIKVIGGLLQKILGTSHTESLSATANIFVGQTEAPLLVRPYIAHMTQSELFAVMVGGLASVAGAVMAGYASMGIELKYLIAASFMAAPGGLLMAKIIKPETEFDRIVQDARIDEDEGNRPANVIDAAANGAASGMKLAANVGAMLLAFISLIAMLNGLIGGIGSMFGLKALSLQQILGYIFTPIAWILGTPSSEALQVGSLIGQKLVLNEFVAYADFAVIKDSLTPHSQAVVTFALCGFANLSSIAILLGGLGVMAPERRRDIARMGLKAVAAGSLSNLMSAALASLFLTL